jgi:hypothetical protein
MILSYGQDTNGGNYRMQQAAAKHGEAESVINALAIGASDPAGVVGRYQIAAEKLGGLRIRSAHRAMAYFDFPTDMTWDRHTEPKIRQLAEAADVIHLNNSWTAYVRFHLRKPAVLHHHGSMFRKDPDRAFAMAKQHRMIQAVSTIDLQQPDPSQLHWLPTAYDVDWLQAYAAENRREPDGRIRIVHCPTNREYKHTAVLEAAVKELQAERLKVDLVIVENVTWAESLAAKAKADIVFDQLLWGYGCNGVEAWGMGIPVISGAEEWTLSRMAQEFPAVPFEEANERTFKDVLRAMVKSADLREDAAQRGLAHVRKYHDELPALTRLAELYAKAIKHHTRVLIPSKADSVTFRNSKGKLVYDDEGNRIVFHDGLVKVSDPFVIERLRGLSKGRPSYGIEEVA